MGQRVRGIRILQTNTNAIIFGFIMLAVAPVFCVLVATTRASALSLPRIIKDITAPVTDILPQKSAPIRPAPAQSESTPAPTPGSGQQTPSASSGATMSTTNTSSNTPQPEDYGTPLEPMPVYTQNLQQLNVQPSQGEQPVLARSLHTTENASFAFLQPSEQGWKILGTPWYLWAFVIAAIIGGWWWIAVRKARHLMSLAFWL